MPLRHMAMGAAWLAAGLWGGGAAAQEDARPRSAIDWLSDSISTPPGFSITPPAPLRNPLPDMPIDASPLDPISREAVGLVPAAQAGLPVSLWGGTLASDVASQITGHPANGVPAARNLFRHILLAEANPPAMTGIGPSPLLARIDRLIEMGATEEAEALIRLAGIDTPEIFDLWFDITLLAGRTQAPCEMARARPGLAPRLSTRVICLARSGDWNAAAITLSIAATLGDVDPLDEEMLIRFLDPALFEDEPDPPPPAPMSATDFFLRESLGMSRPDSGLEPRLIGVDLAYSRPLRQRMEAAERLVQSGGIAPGLLFAAYRAGQPASTGGIWDRVAAVQALDRACQDGTSDTDLAAALERAFGSFSDPDLLIALAEEFAEKLTDRAPLTGPDHASAREIAQLVLVLAGTAPEAWFAGHAQPARPRLPALAHAAALIVASPAALPERASDPLLTAIAAAFAGTLPARSTTEGLQDMLAAGQVGEVILTALAQLSEGPEGDPADIHSGLYFLLAAGQDSSARRIASQILLLRDLAQMP